MQQHQNYTRNVVANREEALSKIVAKVPRGSLVLDVGCGSGMMGRFLSENNECVVDGVDIDPAAVELARPKYRNVAVANLERDSLMDVFKPATYDCIVVADVAEHLVHPEQLFEDIKKLLRPDGTLLFSIPNISHVAAGLELILGKFGYQNSGLLDSTHVRFYSRQGFVDKLASCGIYVEAIDTVQRDFDKTEFAGYQHFPQHWIRDIVNSRDDALTYQWILTARLFKSSVSTNQTVGLAEVDARHISLSARAYWRSAFDDSFSEANTIAGSVGLDSSGEPVMDFDFTETNCRYPLAALRIDLVSDNTVFVFHQAALKSLSHRTLWAAHKIYDSELVNATAVNAPSDGALAGTAVLPENNDPQWYPSLGEAVLQAMAPGAKFSVSMSVSPDQALPIMLAALSSGAAKQALQSTVLLETQAFLQAKGTEVDRLKIQNTQANERLQVKAAEIEQLHAALQSQQLQLDEITVKAAAVEHFQQLALQTDQSLLTKTAEIELLHATLRSQQLQLDEITVKAADVEHFQQLALQTDQSLLAKTTEIELLHATLRSQQLQLDEFTVKAAAVEHFQQLALQTDQSLLAKTAEIEQLHATLRSQQLQLDEITVKAADVEHFQQLALQTDQSLLAKTSEIEQLHTALRAERLNLSSAQATTQELQGRVSQLQIALTEQGQQLQTTQKHFSQALESISWRLTKPLRWVRRTLR